jgi:hypothetical protein
MKDSSPSVIYLPESAPEIFQIAERTLIAAGAKGKLPTPMEDLLGAAKIARETDPEGVVQRFLKSVSEQGRALFQFSLQKVRGIADLRERAVYVPTDTIPRKRFADGHEIGHQVIPWHHVASKGGSRFYHDTDYTLSPSVRELFDIEANLFSSEVIFQGRDFTRRARDYKPSFDAVFMLADTYAASRQATLRRYVQEQDEILAAISYLPSKYQVYSDGTSTLRAPLLLGSPRFVLKYSDIRLPPELDANHPWAQVRSLGQMCDGTIDLFSGGTSVRFWWQAWWNSYSLLVLLRRKPALSMVGRIIKK